MLVTHKKLAAYSKLGSKTSFYQTFGIAFEKYCGNLNYFHADVSDVTSYSLLKDGAILSSSGSIRTEPIGCGRWSGGII